MTIHWLRFAKFAPLLILACALPAAAQRTKWTYHAYNDAFDPAENEFITLVITKERNGFVVSGDYKYKPGANRPYVSCPISGSYSPQNKQVRAYANCQGVRKKYEINASVVNTDELKITRPWEAVARREGAPEKRTDADTNPNIDRSMLPKTINEDEGNYHGVWTLSASGNEYEARWSNGAVATLKIEKFGRNGVKLVRDDSAASVSQNFKAIYTGVIIGNRIEQGRVTYEQNGHALPEGTWSASW